MDKILRESRESVRFMISEPLFKELYDYLKDKKIFIDEFNFKNNEIHGEINHGDWKHEHAYANLCINKFMNDRNIFVEHESWTTESDGSDCYSAKHIWKLFSSDPDLEVDEPIELELQEPVYMKENTNISNRNFTTVDDIISGMIGNMSDESIDTDLKIFSKIAKAIGIKDYTKLVVFIDTDDEYNLKYYSNLFNSVSDLYKAKDIKIYTLDSFVCVVEAHRGGNVFIYGKSETDLDAILDAIDKYNDEPMNESKSDKPLYVIKDSHGNQLSAPNSDDGELWDRVSSMEARGRRGLCVVAYTGKQMNESSDLELSEDEKDDILMTVGAGFETGHHVAKDFEEFKDTFSEISNAKAGWNYYQELVNLGPAGFYAEHKDDYQFDDMFIAEYGEAEDEDNGPDLSNGKVQATAYNHVGDMPYWSKNMSAKDIQHVLNPDINQVKAGVIPFPLVNVQTKKEYGFYIYNPKTNKYVYTNDWDKRDALLKKFGHINESKSIKEKYTDASDVIGWTQNSPDEKFSSIGEYKGYTYGKLVSPKDVSGWYLIDGPDNIVIGNLSDNTYSSKQELLAALRTEIHRLSLDESKPIKEANELNSNYKNYLELVFKPGNILKLKRRFDFCQGPISTLDDIEKAVIDAAPKFVSYSGGHYDPERKYVKIIFPTGTEFEAIKLEKTEDKWYDYLVWFKEVSTGALVPIDFNEGEDIRDLFDGVPRYKLDNKSNEIDTEEIDIEEVEDDLYFRGMRGEFGSYEDSVAYKMTDRAKDVFNVNHDDAYDLAWKIISRMKDSGYDFKEGEALDKSKSIKESKDMYCVYFEQDGYEQLEFTGTIDECNKYISDIQSEQEAEFGDEAPERFIKKFDESNVSSVYTEEVTDLVHDDWKQPEADVAVFVKGDYRIQKVENDGKETWEVLHYKGDTNEGTSMGKCDSIEAAKKKADDDAKKSEPKTVTEDYDSKTTEFNDQYFPRVDLTEYEYYKHGDYEYAYDITHGLLIQLFKDEDEVAEFGIDEAPFRELDIVGLSRDIWADTQARDDYLTQHETEVEAEVQAELQNLI